MDLKRVALVAIPSCERLYAFPAGETYNSHCEIDQVVFIVKSLLFRETALAVLTQKGREKINVDLFTAQIYKSSTVTLNTLIKIELEFPTLN